MKQTYKKTVWEDNVTPVNAKNLQNIENSIETLYDLALDPASIKAEGGLKLETTTDGIKIESTWKIITEELEEYDENTTYFLVNKSTGAVIKVIAKGIGDDVESE